MMTRFKKQGSGQKSWTGSLMAVTAATAMVFAAGCSDDDDPVTPEPTTIVDIAAGDANFSILVAALERAGLVDTLDGDGPFTVFAPTNAAFEAAGITSVDDFTKEELQTILLYHVIAASVASDAIPAKADSVLLNQWGNGVTLVFDTSDGVKVNTATVQLADIESSNGIVHVIDEVLMPPNVVEMASIAGFSSLVSAVLAADDLDGGLSVAEALTADTSYTVFAPTNDAFTTLGPVNDTQLLRDVLLLHVVNSTSPVLSGQLPASADSLLTGEQLSFDAGGPSVSSSGTSNAGIVLTDINVTNGVIHALDSVLLL